MNRIKVWITLALAFALCLLGDIRDPFVDGGKDNE
jgi:hypothetical protein